MKLGFLSKSRGTRGLIFRIFTVLCRFGISPKRFERRLKKYYEITHRAGYLPTFAITAVVLERHPDYIEELNRQGVEFAVHGYVHIDYKMCAREKKETHFKKAIEVFNRCGIPFVGFRAPFLRVNKDTKPILNKLGFLYHSSRVLFWPVIDLSIFSTYARNSCCHLMEFCTPLDADKYLSLPKKENGLIEIPVSLPDDETIIERLGITDEMQICEIWLEILRKIYSRGELFILSLHPERIDYCETALLEILRKSRELKPQLWVATLKEIAEWWKEKINFNIEMRPLGEGKYQVRASCSDRATVLVRNARVDVPAHEWMDGYLTIDKRNFILESEKRPVIGVGAKTSPAAIAFLKSEGYIVEEGGNPDDYGIYLDNLKQFNDTDEKPLSQKIEAYSDAPLLRYWRWPYKSRSALSVTGDIDSITLSDFVFRIIENWRKNC